MYFQKVSRASRLALHLEGMKMNSPLIRSAAALLPATTLLLYSIPALSLGATGADATAEAPVLDEIVVTAQRREQRIQDVPISLSVMGGAAVYF